MSKLVVIRLDKGSLKDGFSLVAAQYWETRNSLPTQFTASLPPAPEIADFYHRFQLIYESLHHRMGKRSLIEIDLVGLNHVSEVDFTEVQQQLYEALNDWLNSNSFRPIDQQLRARLALDDELQVIFETSNHLLRQLPWYLWNFFEDYQRAEVGLSFPKYERIKPLTKKHSRNQVRILAILGNSAGIDIQEDRKILEELPNSSTVFLVEPSRQELDTHLYNGKGWDILFFAGHSHSQNNQGKIHINQNSTLTITELRNALKFAIQRGLKLAIFNSCDGLGLTQQLADLQIPQTIVMRHNIPNLVAQEFLKYFLTSFASGEPLYLAMRYARERLQGLEDRYPGASWLPVVCQNPAEEPLTWQEMKNFPNLLPTRLRRLLQTVLLSVLTTALVIILQKLILPLLPVHEKLPFQHGDIISLKCQGNTEKQWLDGVTSNRTVALAPTTDRGFTGTKWKVFDEGDGVVALRTVGNDDGIEQRWLRGRKDGTVGLANKDSRTKWKVNVFNKMEGIIQLENLGDFLFSPKLLNCATEDEYVHLDSDKSKDDLGTQWKVQIKSRPH